MSLIGSATPEGTSRYQDRFQATAADRHFRNAQSLSLSSLGIGTYLGNPDEATDKRYADAVVRSVQLGMNVIDSAANYRFQRSERSIGQALRTLTEETGFDRDEMVICTKGGYLPFDGQLEQSLQNLGIDCVDVYYIHNPESQLGFVTADEFYRRLGRAFKSLEQSIIAGKIKSYGVATWNGFRVPEDSNEHHSLSRILDEARAVGGESHGFRFIQLPYNLAMPEAFNLRNQTLGDKRLTILEAAAASGVSVIASASILQGRVARGLPKDLRESLGSLATDAQTAIQFVRSTPGITTGLVGMSHREHVEENARLVQVEPLPPEEFLNAFAA